MLKIPSNPKLAFLGIAVIAIVSAVSTPNAQEHPYVVHLNEQCRLPGCAVLPSTWQECNDIRNQQEYDEDERYRKATQKIMDRRFRFNLLERSGEIYTAIQTLNRNTYGDRVEAAKEKAAAAVIAAQAQLVACELALASLTGPAFWTAQVLCLTKHSVALAAIYSTLEKVKKDAKDDADRADELAWTEHQLRSNLINAKCDRQEEFAALQHSRILADIEAEYQKCWDYTLLEINH